jgi:hypothetical protein
MQIERTSAQEVVMNDPDFKAVLEKIEEALKRGRIVDDPCNGYGKHIRVDVSTEDWMQPLIDELYEPRGWKNISFKFFDRIMFMIPTRLRG